MFQDARQMLSGRTPLLLWRVGKRYRVQSRFLVVIDCYRAGMNQSNIVRTNNTLVWWTKMTLSTFRSQRFLSEKNQDRTNYALLRAKNSRKTCTSTRTREYHTPTSTIIPRMILSYRRYLLLACLLACSLDRAWFSIPARSYFTIIGFSALVHYSALDKILRLG